MVFYSFSDVSLVHAASGKHTVYIFELMRGGERTRKAAGTPVTCNINLCDLSPEANFGCSWNLNRIYGYHGN